jgi:hypothetical protein
MDNEDPRFPSSRFLRVACFIVPKGSPPPLEWMAAHPNYVTVRGVIIPCAPLEPDMELEPQPESEGQTEPLPEKPTYRVEIDYAGNWIIKGVTVMMPRPTEPLSARPQEPEPAGSLSPAPPADPPPGPMRHRRQPEPPTPPPWPQGIAKPSADRLFAVGYRAGREAAPSPTSHARTDRRVKAVEEAIIAQARADGLASVAGAVALDPVVDLAILAALAALGVVKGAEVEPPHPYVPARTGGRVFPGFEPPPPSPPLPGLVPPPLSKTKPGEGRFTEAPPTPPLPGFTPSPPSAPVHPGQPAEANKPIIVSHTDGPDKPAAKGPLPPAKADVRGVRRYNPNVPSHAKAAAAEAELAAKVHGMPDQQVVVSGGPIGSHGADVISVDTRTGAVTLWDAKYRGENVRVGASTTFEAGKDARNNAIRQAIAAIRDDKTLSPEIRDKAEENLLARRIRTITTGFGKAKNSVSGK